MLFQKALRIINKKYKDSTFVLQKKAYVLFWILLLVSFIFLIILPVLFLFFDFNNEILVIAIIDIIGLVVILFSVLLLLKGRYYIATNLLSVYFIIFISIGCIARFTSIAETGINSFTFFIFSMLSFCAFYNSRKFLMATMVYFLILNIILYLPLLINIDIQNDKNTIVSSVINSSMSVIVVSSLAYLISSITDKALKITENELLKNIELNITLEKKVEERTKKLSRANKKLKDLSLVDPLTGLRNRRFVYEVVSEMSDNFIASKCNTSKIINRRDNTIEKKVLGVYLMDIDYFKQINDTYGHKAGDSILISLSNIIKSLIRRDDIIVRWGGEEFLIILNRTHFDYYQEFPRKVKDAIEKYSFKLPNKKTIHKTCSIGCTAMPVSEKQSALFTLENIISLCDFGLYQAKEKGRNKIAFVNIRKPDIVNKEKKQYLLSLSKDSVINPHYISIKFS